MPPEGLVQADVCVGAWGWEWESSMLSRGTSSFGQSQCFKSIDKRGRGNVGVGSGGWASAQLPSQRD